VSVRNNALSQQKKQQIAKEFNYAATAFLHDAPHAGQARKVDLFSPTEELDFAGHAVLGTAHYIFQKLEAEEHAPSGGRIPRGQPQTAKCSLHTKAGLIQSHFDAVRQVAAIDVPHEVHVHALETTKDEILAVQGQLLSSQDTAKMKGSYPVVSIAKGLAFTLVDFTTCPTLQSLLRPGEAPDPSLDAGWKPTSSEAPLQICGCVYFLQLQTDFTDEPYITRLQVRAIAGGIEEAATASGCCALAAYLSLQKGGRNSRHAYAIEQGDEIGRRSQLCIEVRLNEHGTGVARVTLSARATFVLEGRLL